MESDFHISSFGDQIDGGANHLGGNTAGVADKRNCVEMTIVKMINYTILIGFQIKVLLKSVWVFIISLEDC